MTVPTPAPAPVRRARARSIVMIVVGAVLVLAGPILGMLAGSFATIPSALKLGDQTATVQPEATLKLKADEKLYLLAPVNELAQVGSGDCTVIAPQSSATVVAQPANAHSTRVHGSTYTSFASITASADGTYTINCQTTVPVVAAPPLDVTQLLGPFLWLTAAGVAFGIAGIVIVIVGVVRMARR